MRRNRPLSWILTAGLLALASPVHADEVAPRGWFPTALKIDDRKLRLNGTGLLEWGLFEIDVYWGALYLERPTRSARTVIASKQLKRIELKFVRGLTKSQLKDAFTAAFEANAGKQLPAYREGLKTLCGWMRDIKAKQSLVFTIRPETGLEVRQAGKKRGVIKGDAFSKMFLTLYFGKKPPTAALRRGLLGLKGE